MSRRHLSWVNIVDKALVDTAAGLNIGWEARWDLERIWALWI
jgi:hypothetical protein